MACWIVADILKIKRKLLLNFGGCPGISCMINSLTKKSQFLWSIYIVKVWTCFETQRKLYQKSKTGVSIVKVWTCFETQRKLYQKSKTGVSIVKVWTHFETQRKLYLKSKTGVSMASQKVFMSSKNIKKKTTASPLLL